MEKTLQESIDRVTQSEKLKRHYIALCEYDWENRQEHINWVCTAPEDEIEEWAESLE
jgi:hypothetical protein